MSGERYIRLRMETMTTMEDPVTVVRIEVRTGARKWETVGGPVPLNDGAKDTLARAIRFARAGKTK
jgi:hypothetical protein